MLFSDISDDLAQSIIGGVLDIYAPIGVANQAGDGDNKPPAFAFPDGPGTGNPAFGIDAQQAGFVSGKGFPAGFKVAFSVP